MAFSQFAPVTETGAELGLERSILDGTMIGGVAYGALLTIFIQCIVVLWNPRYGKRNWALLCYTCVMFTLGTLGNASKMRFAELAFIDGRSHRGGPLGFMAAEFNHWVNAMGAISYILAGWFQDGLVLYRMWVIWNRSYKIVLLPTIMFLASIVFSGFLMFGLTQPGHNLRTTFNFALPFWCLAISLNIVSAGLIVGRLLWMRNAVRAALGVRHSRHYTSIVAMIIESASLNVVVGVIFVICYVLQSSAQNLFLSTMGQIQSIAPLLIIMRVGQGRAWSDDTSGARSTIRWNRNGQASSLSTIMRIQTGGTEAGMTSDSMRSKSETHFHKAAGELV